MEFGENEVRLAEEFFQAIGQETDRGQPLVAAAFLDRLLQELLEEWFGQCEEKPKDLLGRLFRGFGPLSSFSAKIDLVYAMNLVSSDEWHDLHQVRKLRNYCAHSVGPFSFEEPKAQQITLAFVVLDSIEALDEGQSMPAPRVNCDWATASPTEKAHVSGTRLAVVTGWMGASLALRKTLMKSLRSTTEPALNTLRDFKTKEAH